MKFYVKVTTYSATTKLGKIVAAEVEKKFDKSLLDDTDLARIHSFIHNCQASAWADNRRLQPMKIRSYGFVPGNSGRLLSPGNGAQIWMSSDTGETAFSSNRPFTLTLYPVLLDYTDPSAASMFPYQEGGDK